MPRFYFDAEDGGVFIDPDGTDLPDFDAAKREALRILCQLLPVKGQHLEHGDFTITVSDHERMVLMKITVAALFSPAVTTGSRFIRPEGEDRS